MALGDTSQRVGWTGSSSASITYVCPECQTGNVTAGISTGLAPDLAPTVYARVTCTSCGHSMLVAVSYGRMSVTVQQTS